MSQALADVLQLTRRTEVVDIGANPIDGTPPYKRLLDAGLVSVTGFDPNPDAHRRLEASKGPNERYLPYAVGDGAEHELKICRAEGMSSLLEPDPAALRLFDYLTQCAEVIERRPIQTRRLDDLTEIDLIDLLKMDVQGSELSVLLNGQKKLEACSFIQLEVSFVPLYVGQPPIGVLDSQLRAMGFMPHCVAGAKNWIISPCLLDNDPRKPMNQILEADLVYVRDLTKPEAISDEILSQMAFLAHGCYGSVDLALHCISLLSARGALAPDSPSGYLSLVGRPESAR